MSKSHRSRSDAECVYKSNMSSVELREEHSISDDIPSCTDELFAEKVDEVLGENKKKQD